MNVVYESEEDTLFDYGESNVIKLTVPSNLQRTSIYSDSNMLDSESQESEYGQILDLPSLPTLSDGTAGGIEPGSITFEFNQKYSAGELGDSVYQLNIQFFEHTRLKEN